jgi:hypothetical protein
MEKRRIQHIQLSIKGNSIAKDNHSIAKKMVRITNAAKLEIRLTNPVAKMVVPETSV